MPGPNPDTDRVAIGRITGPHGVRGWVRISSYTRPPHNILNYRPWIVAGATTEDEREPVESRVAGSGVVVRFDGIADRDSASGLRGRRIEIRRAQLPALPRGQYYWSDLIGMEVVDRSGAVLGSVAALHETGANDVLVVEGEHRLLIPFVTGRFVETVELEAGRIRVNWDATFG